MKHYFTFMKGYQHEGEDMAGYWVEVETERISDAWEYLAIWYDPAWAVHWLEGEFCKVPFTKGLLKKII